MPPRSTPAPATVLVAAAVVGVQALVLAAVAVTLTVRHLAGVHDEPWLSAYGTAAWFALAAVAVGAAGAALWTGRRWGRGIAVFANLLLLPVAWYMVVDSGRWEYGVPVAVAAIAVLGLLFSPPTLQWLVAPSPVGPDSEDPANSDKAGPDTR